jgi:uncharacterized membrane protein YccF (DUF307 family)
MAINEAERRTSPIRQEVADLFASTSLKLLMYVVLFIFGWWLVVADGSPTNANKKLVSTIGITNPKRVKRQPAKPPIKAITGAMTYAKAPPAIIHPMAFALFSNGKSSPISVTPIGETIAHPNPLKE